MPTTDEMWDGPDALVGAGLAQDDDLEVGRLACVGGLGVVRESSSDELAKHRMVTCSSKPTSSSSGFQAKIGVEVGCENCKFDVTGDVHILARTSKWNPFEETWISGEVRLPLI